MIFHIDRRLGILSCLLMLIMAALGWYIYFKLNRSLPPQLPNNKPPIYGEILPWEQVNQVFPKYAQCTVQDFETGKQFRVVRRGGSSHADVQPLTARDTEIMKSIYGQWSWRRRAILIKLVDGQMVAGSMNGMPHGAGAIKNNNFNGHFCIHFKGSKTHGSGKVDRAHQVMIWKAAGTLEEELWAMQPSQVLDTFFAILNQGDEDLLRAFLIDAGDLYDVKSLLDIEYCELRKVEPLNESTYTVSLRLRRAGVKGEQTVVLSPILSQNPYWRVRMESLDALYTRPGLQTLARTRTRLQLCAVRF